MEIFEAEKTQKIINKQVPYWELMIGISLICGMLIIAKEKIAKLKVGIETWDNLLPEKDDKN